MTLNELIDKDVRVIFINGDEHVGKLVDIDTKYNLLSIHVYFNSQDILIPLSNVKSITEHY